MTEPDFDTEDQLATKRLTVFEAGAVRTASIRAGAAREGDEGEETTRVRIDVDGHSGISIEGRLRSVGGTATPGVDYEPVDARIEVIPYSSEASVEFKLLSDTLDEADETIEFELSGIDGAQPETVRGTFTIRDDDDPAQAGRAGLSGVRLARLRRGQLVRAARAQARRAVGEKALTPDGRFLWVADDKTIVRLKRDPATGALERRHVLGHERSGPRLRVARRPRRLPVDVLITPDGKQLIVRGVAYDEGNPVMGLVSLALDAAWRADAHRLRRQGCSGL